MFLYLNFGSHFPLPPALFFLTSPLICTVWGLCIVSFQLTFLGSCGLCSVSYTSLRFSYYNLSSLLSFWIFFLCVFLAPTSKALPPRGFIYCPSVIPTALGVYETTVWERWEPSPQRHKSMYLTEF